ncbi:MAG: NAD(P)-dependent oxidoreductase [Clostridiales bacterium]|nr:NAD(P)-dependent oxidoreductase [Clostridiales bacterium]
MKDWVGNKQSSCSTMGARNYAFEERESNDYYATEPKALELLLDIENFSNNVWECACGEGHLSKVLEARGYNVRSSDLCDRGFGESDIDFLKQTEKFDGDIITNPPYKYGREFVEKALELIPNGHRAAFFLKIQFLEGKARRKLFDTMPPRKIYVSSGRLHCAMNGDFEKYSKFNAVSYAWFIWEKGYKGTPEIRWFN